MQGFFCVLYSILLLICMDVGQFQREQINSQTFLKIEICHRFMKIYSKDEILKKKY